ncbi:DNA polymerase III subunit beta [Clostridium tyrobutyricum]|uniref:DNA polymerase III subunit beta n=1 Tax=Clostridium tyrobutyricum TaxID=1519 RepID=UPI001C385256|nr:DNA polymerase III subunit beta [Clostridium tyrobutyricum]MBV4417136.1 DNA polymerase III subunit beta [Clostridium tyrobutyricum]
MKIIVDNQELKNILHKYIKLIYAKGVDDEQKSLYIKTLKNAAEFKICDPINHIEMSTILEAQIIEEGECLIPNSLLKVMEGVESHKIRISNNEIFYGHNSINYSSLKYEFVFLAELNYSELLRVPENELYRLIKNVSYCTAKDEIRPILTGVNITKNKFTALDGYRLSISNSDKFNINESITLPLSLINLLLKILNKKSNDEVTFMIDDKGTYLKLKVEDILITLRLLEGNYIRYESLIPEDYLYEIKVDAERLLKKLKTLFSLKKSSKEICKLIIQEDRLCVENNNSASNIKDHIDIDLISHNELPFEIAFNPLYLRDILKNYNDDIIIKFNSAIGPIVVDQDNNIDLMLPVILRK